MRSFLRNRRRPDSRGQSSRSRRRPGRKQRRLRRLKRLTRRPRWCQPRLVPPQAEPAEEERVAAEPVESAEAELATEPAENCAAARARGERSHAEAEAGRPKSEPAAEPGPDWDAEESSRDVSPLAVVGIILGIIALVGVAVGVLAVVTHGFRPKTVVTYRPAAVFGLRPGQCIDSGSDALKFTVLSCARPHDAEVFATFTLPATAWPGASAVRLDAGNGCASRFDSYIEPAARDGRPDPGIRLPEPGRLAGRRAHRGVRGQRGERAAHRFGPRATGDPGGTQGLRGRRRATRRAASPRAAGTPRRRPPGPRPGPGAGRRCGRRGRARGPGWCWPRRPPR